VSVGAREASTERRSGFDVGDAVVSPRHGPGTITARGPRASDEARREYLTVELCRRGMTLMIPLEGVAGSGLRPLSSPAQARRALDVLATEPRGLPPNWRYRRKEVSEQLRSGRLLDLAGLLRDLTHAAKVKSPGRVDREHCEKARELLESELALVLGAGASTEIDARLAGTRAPVS
jgi:CarD family transcriptional regulator